MSSDPKRAMWIAIGVAGLAAAWLLLQWPLGEQLFDALSYTVYAIDLLAIFALVAGLVVALLFARFSQVRADLLAGRNVVARWHVTAEQLAAFAGTAIDRDRSDKRGALLLVAFFVVVIFGAFAVFDPEAAPMMLGIAALVLVAVGIAYLISGRVMRGQLRYRSGDVIVGRDGLLLNDALHVWGIPLSWLAGTRLEPGILTVTYAFIIRFGVQMVDVALPVPEEARGLANEAVAALGK